MTVAAARAPRPVIDDRPALASAPLRPGFDRADLSRYGDPGWDLGPAVFRENARRCHVTVHFDAVGDPDVRGRCARSSTRGSTPIFPATARSCRRPARAKPSTGRDASSTSFGFRSGWSISAASTAPCLMPMFASSRPSGGGAPSSSPSSSRSCPICYVYRDHLPFGGLRFEPWPGRSPSWSQVAALIGRTAPHDSRVDHHTAPGVVAALHHDLCCRYSRRSRRA